MVKGNGFTGILYSGVRVLTGNYPSSTSRELRERGVKLELTSLYNRYKCVSVHFRNGYYTYVTTVSLLKPPPGSRDPEVSGLKYPLELFFKAEAMVVVIEKLE